MKLGLSIAVVLMALVLKADVSEDAYIAYAMKEYKRAFELLEPLESQMKPGVSYLLGTIYLEANATKQDIPKALKLLEHSADAGNSAALMRLIRYYSAEGASDSSLKYALILQSRLEGKSSSQFICANASLLLRVGEHKRAFAQFKSASKKFKVPCATYGLAFMYENGYGVSKNMSAAKKLYDIAFKKRYAKASYRLGLIKLKECKTAQDKMQAEMFFNQAYIGGVKKAKVLYDKLRSTKSCLLNDTKG